MNWTTDVLKGRNEALAVFLNGSLGGGGGGGGSSTMRGMVGSGG